MSPRQRTVSDDDILAAAARVVGRMGSADMTLADVGKEAGLSPATLLQRFGSKRGLLIALAASSVDQIDQAFAQIRAELDSPVAALIAAAGLSNERNFVSADFRDADLHRHALDRARRLRECYRKLVVEAMEDGELVESDAESLARAVESVATGALITWSIHREGDAATFVRR